MNLVRQELNYQPRNPGFPLKDTCLAIYSRTINSGEPLKKVLAKHFPACSEWKEELRELFKRYTGAKRRQNVLDYDDLLLYWARMLDNDEIAAEIGGMFDHILVDEYQDTNRLQSEILLKLKPDGRGLVVVGDDAQASFRFVPPPSATF